MSPEEAIDAIEKAHEVVVLVRISTSFDGSSHDTAEFPVQKPLVIDAIKKMLGSNYVPDIFVSADGTRVTLGREPTAQLPQNFSHFESNNGNF